MGGDRLQSGKLEEFHAKVVHSGVGVVSDRFVLAFERANDGGFNCRTVTDPSGAVIAGANITITNMGTNIAVKTTTDTAGEFVVTPLEVGKYSVSVEATGFKRSVRSDIQVNVQDRVRVDSKLE